MSREAVIDATLLSRLERTGLAVLLPLLFDRVHVPPEVADEVAQSPAGSWLDSQLDASGAFLRRCRERDRVVEEFLAMDLDRGEAAVLAQADFHQARGVTVVAISDDGDACKVARAQNLTPMRTGRLLVELKDAGHIAAVAPYLDGLQAEGLWLGRSHRAAILRMAGEA